MANASFVRDFVIPGECLVSVKGIGALWTSPPKPRLWELGLSSEGIQVSPTYYHRDVNADDFGANVAPERLWDLAYCDIDMTLVHYDHLTLNCCMSESMGGASTGGEGILMGAGTPLGGGMPLWTSGCHYISLNISSPQLDYPWRFPTTYLAERPAVLPFGVEASLARLHWRAVPYRPVFISGYSKWFTGNFNNLNPAVAYAPGSPFSGVFAGGPNPNVIAGIPYTPAEPMSSGCVLWDHEVDDNFFDGFQNWTG